MDLGLQKKIVIISGATGAIGGELCRAFLDEGAIIVPLYRKEEKFRKLFEELKYLGLNTENIYPHETNFNSSEAVIKIAKYVISRYGSIDVLINNVGKSTERPFLMMEEAEWENEVNINLNITARMIRIVLKHMFIAKKGAIVNVSSLVSTRYGRGVTAYAAAKAGIDRMTQTIAQEVGPKGIRINAVCPGIIKTEMSKPVIDRSGEYILSETALNRFGNPGDVSGAVLFLASDKAASFITGRTVVVDGGLGL